MKRYTEVQLDRARQSLESAEKLVDSDPNSSASRAYYAMFHSLLAVFSEQGKDFRKHREVRTALHRDLVNAGLVREEIGQDYNEVMDLRELGDYGGMSVVSRDDADRALAKAKRFVAAMVSVCCA